MFGGVAYDRLVREPHAHAMDFTGKRPKSTEGGLARKAVPAIAANQAR